MEKKRLPHIDLLKVIAIFFVMIYHGSLYSVNFLEEEGLVVYLNYFFTTILSTCVPLFFFVNGYLLFGRGFDLRNHILKTGKFIIQTLLWAGITLLFLQVTKYESFTVKEFVKEIWHLEDGRTTHLWYMGALVCIYILFPILKNVYDSNFKLFVYFTIACTVLTFGNTIINAVGTIFAGSMLDRTTVYEGINFFNIFNPFRGMKGYTIVYFCAGGIAYHFKDRIAQIDLKKRNVLSVTGICLSCLGLFGLGVYFSNLQGLHWEIVWNGYDSVFTLLNVIFIYVLSLNWKKDIRWIRLVSSNTLGIYFVHMCIRWVTRPMITEFSFTRNVPVTLVYAGFLVAVSTALCWLIKKCPIVSYLIK